MTTLRIPIEWMLIFYIPAVVVGIGLVLMKRAHVLAAREPFTEKPLRFAGESSRDKSDSLFESATEDMLAIFVGCPALGLICATVQGPGRYKVGVTSFVAASIAALWFWRRLRRKLRKSWNYRLGAKGEQVVGRELDRLTAQGYQVFHDVQFSGWNIDHVVVGPKGVFAIETKTWRKPSKATALKAEILFDGKVLILPDGRTREQPLIQARRNAESLSDWIAKAAGEQIAVCPVIALPGWGLKIQRYGDVGVYSATHMSEHLLNRGKGDLAANQIQRIAFQLAQRCELKDA